MRFKRLRLSDLVFGEPLRWDIFGPADGAASASPAGAAPLLEKGQLITPGPRLDGLLAAGLYADAGAPASVLHMLNQIARHLELVLMDLPAHMAAEAELRQAAHELIAAIKLDADVALACVLLNQVAGPYGVRHCVETAVVAAFIDGAQDKAPAEVLSLTAAALTMNVSMLHHTESFRCKESALSSEERAIVRRHPSESAEMLRAAGVGDQEWLACVALHHEHEDGSGYPEGKQGFDVSRNAKLIAMADRYCAYVAARNYRRSLLPHLALHKLCAESKFPVDTQLAAQFTEKLGNYPPGTLVRLANDEIGVVMRRAGPDGALPVRVLKGADGKAPAGAPVRMSGEPGCALAEALQEDQAGIRFSMKRVWGELASL